MYRSSRIAIFVATLLLIIYLYPRSSISRESFNYVGFKNSSPKITPLTSLSLHEAQCAHAFPGLYKEIDRALQEGPFELRRARNDTPGLVQGRIKDGKLYIITAAPDNALHRVPAVLHSIHRALTTSPEPIPDTIFALTVNDVPRPSTWSFARSDDDLTPNTTWLMPHYSSWSWATETLGPLDDARARIDRVEKDVPWVQKIDKAIWRGTQWLNPDWRPGLRGMLVETAREQEWADVEFWVQGENNTLKVEDFCKYKYIIYAEGKTYSGRLPYHQTCSSIILTPPPTFVLHASHFFRPVFSSLLPLNASLSTHPKTPTSPSAESYPIPNARTTWPLSFPPDLANIVYVAPDWSDLPDTIAFLRQNPDIAEGIAQRQRELFVSQGYHSESAEACYWRALIRAWSSMARVVDKSEWEQGMRFETYVLLGKTTYD